MQKNNYSNTKTLTTMALLIALNVVLSRFLSINTEVVKIGFSFVTIFIAGYLFGPVKGAVVAGLADLIGAHLFPFGTYFFGFTFTALLCGFVWGFFNHKKVTLPKLIITILINNFVFSLFLNTYWIHVLYGSSFQALFATRFIQSLILAPIEIIVCFVLSKQLSSITKI